MGKLVDPADSGSAVARRIRSSRIRRTKYPRGGMVDTRHLGCRAVRCTGSSPVGGTYCRIAQLNRASDFGSEGCWFEPSYDNYIAVWCNW